VGKFRDRKWGIFVILDTVDRSLDRTEDGGELLPLVEQDRLLVAFEGNVRVRLEHGRLARLVEADDAGRVASHMISTKFLTFFRHKFLPVFATDQRLPGEDWHDDRHCNGADAVMMQH